MKNQFQNPKNTHNTIDFLNLPNVPNFLKKDVKEKLAFVGEFILRVSILENGTLIRFHLKKKLDGRNRKKFNKDVAKVVENLVVGAFEPRIRTLENYLDRPVHYYLDPTLKLIEAGELIQEGSGYHILGPKLTRLISFIERRFLKLAKSMGAQPYQFPALIPADYMEKVKYFSNFPHSLSFVSHLKEDLEVIEKFASLACCSDGVVDFPKESYSSPKAMLTPTVCHHLFYALANKAIPSDGLTVTAYGNCFRYESTNMVSLERLWNFTMREIIFVGSEKYVKDGLDHVRRKLRTVLADLQLAYKIETASDPFFIGTHKNQTAYQNALELKFELRALLPFKKESIAVGSFNRHQDFFGTQLNFVMDNGDIPQTGCIGLGYERLAYAFVSQHGLDTKNWPNRVRKYMENESL